MYTPNGHGNNSTHYSLVLSLCSATSSVFLFNNSGGDVKKRGAEVVNRTVRNTTDWNTLQDLLKICSEESISENLGELWNQYDVQQNISNICQMLDINSVKLHIEMGDETYQGPYFCKLQIHIFYLLQKNVELNADFLRHTIQHRCPVQS